MGTLPQLVYGAMDWLKSWVPCWVWVWVWGALLLPVFAGVSSPPQAASAKVKVRPMHIFLSSIPQSPLFAFDCSKTVKITFKK